jgi:hypothetical protein
MATFARDIAEALKPTSQLGQLAVIENMSIHNAATIRCGKSYDAPNSRRLLRGRQIPHMIPCDRINARRGRPLVFHQTT